MEGENPNRRNFLKGMGATIATGAAIELAGLVINTDVAEAATVNVEAQREALALMKHVFENTKAMRDTLSNIGKGPVGGKFISSLTRPEILNKIIEQFPTLKALEPKDIAIHFEKVSDDKVQVKLVITGKDNKQHSVTVSASPVRR